MLAGRSHLALVGLCLATTLPVCADPLLDFSLFDVPPVEQRVQQMPLMRWLVRDDAEQFCEAIALKDGHVNRPGGCVYWQLSAGTCVMVTTPSTTHSQLGHLFVHCLQGK